MPHYTIQNILLPLFLLCLLVMTPLAAQAKIDELEQLFREEQYTKLISQLNILGEKNFDEEQYRLYVYALSNDDLDDAEDAAQRAIKKFDTDPDMFLMHASIMGNQAQQSIFSALGYAEKALESLNKAVSLSPNEPKYLNALMSFYLAAPSIAGGDMDKAREIATTIATIDALDGTNAMARFYLSNEQPQQALIILKEAVNTYPNNIAIYGQIAGVYSSQENYEQAISYYEKATLVELATLSDTDLLDDDLNDKRAGELFVLLNSHYQIGRTALLSKTQANKGILHLTTYIQQYESANINLSGLPSVSWARLRLAGLIMINNEPKLAQETLALVTLQDDANMKKIHKALSKQIIRSLN
jgi:tetratricopeptide (TPR) repeat protein